MPGEPTKSRQDLKADELQRHNQRLQQIEENRTLDLDQAYKNYQNAIVAEDQEHRARMDELDKPAGAPPPADPEGPADTDQGPASPAWDEYLENVELINKQSDASKGVLQHMADIGDNYHRSPGELKVIKDGLASLWELVDVRRESLLEDAKSQYDRDKPEGEDNEVHQDGG